MSQAELDSGRRKLDWARSHMPVHAELRRRYSEQRPFDGVTIAVGSHIEAKTGVFIETLAAAGADVVFTNSVSATTQDDVVAALLQHQHVQGYARHGCSDNELHELHLQTLRHGPQLILDDAAELTALLLDECPDLRPRVLGVCEQTSTGVQRLQAMARDGVLSFPALAVNDTPMKHDFDNVHGTGESALTNLLAVTNLLLAGKRVVVAGFGYCGQGVAYKAQGWGARVTITEIDPRKALRAHMAGFEVAPMTDAVRNGDIYITTTGNRDVLRREHFEYMRDGAVIANAGHFHVEIAVHELQAMARGMREVRPGISEYELSDGRRINVVAHANLVNLAAPTSMGHPIEVMDQTFAMQFVAALYLLQHRARLGAGVHALPTEVDAEVAALKLASLGISIDRLSATQQDYIHAWRIGDIQSP